MQARAMAQAQSMIDKGFAGSDDSEANWAFGCHRGRHEALDAGRGQQERVYQVLSCDA